jgi:putative ABC transport system permease protein
MKYFPLLWAGIWRKRSRAVLMLLQIITAFVLFGILQGLSSGVKQAIARTHADRLYIASSVSTGDSLPVGLLGKIRSIAGVVAVTPRSDFGGNYQKPNQFVPVTAADPETFARVYSELKMSKDAIAELSKTRDGGIAGVALMKQYGWKVGDRVVLQTAIPQVDGSRDWTFDIVGTYDVNDDPVNTAGSILANFDYLNDARFTGRDRTDLFVATVTSAGDAARVALAIDNAFANSDHETRTQSEGDLVEAQIQQTVDLNFIVRAIITAVFFALLLATGALMMQSIREREAELAVLKTVGFSDALVMTLILGESLVLCVFAAACGLGIAGSLLLLARNQIGIAHLPVNVLLLGLAFAVLLALCGGSAPALRGSRLQVVDALADR